MQMVRHPNTTFVRWEGFKLTNIWILSLIMHSIEQLTYHVFV